MSLKILVRFVPSVLILSGLAALHPAAAQFVTFGSAQKIAASTDVSNLGTFIAAYNFGSNTPLVNGVTFSPVTSTGGSGSLTVSGADNFYNGYSGTGGSGAAFNGLDSSYQSLLTNGLYKNAAAPMGFTQSNLTAGERYQVQYFVDDSRALAANRNESVSSSGGNAQTLNYNSSGAEGGVGQYVNGTFTATIGGKVTMTATGNESTQINGLQYRDLGNAGAPITFGTPIAIGTADATLGGQTGTIITAADFGAGNQTVAFGNGQVITFDGSGANATVVGGNGTTTGAFTGNTGNTAFDTVLNGFNYDSAAGTKQITLSGLTAGKQYSVQLFGLDDRGGNESLRTLSFSDFSSNSSGSITSGANDYVIGTFTAASAFQTITENITNGGNINALVVRDLSGVSAAPEPSQIASLALAALGMLGVVLKARKRKAAAELS